MNNLLFEIISFGFYFIIPKVICWSWILTSLMFYAIPSYAHKEPLVGLLAKFQNRPALDEKSLKRRV